MEDRMKDNTFLWAALGVAIAAMLFVAIETAWGQTAVVVDLDRAQLRWNWVGALPPDGDKPDKFIVKCGREAGVYTRLTELPYSASPTGSFSAPLRPLIAGNGNWFCAVSAANVFGESENSNEVPFVVGVKPSAPTNAEVVAQ
jgi:hypothetical protein